MSTSERVAPGALRLLLVTPDDRSPRRTLALIEASLAGGVTAVLLRERGLPAAERERLYADSVARCRAVGALALVSNEPGLALRVGADGVHLGWGGPAVAAARAAAPGLLAGRSCHWPPGAEDRLADYLTLSPFRPTPASHPRPLLTARQVAAVVADAALGPVVALGGLQPADVPDLPDGLAGLAVLRALSQALDPRGTAAVLRSLADARWSLGVPG